VKPLNDCWILLCLNMDRNTLWGSAGGMVFVDQQSWDVSDRFEYLARATAEVVEQAGRSLLGSGKSIGFFNPLNWQRNDPFIARSPSGRSVQGASTETLADGSVLLQTSLPPVSVGTWKPVRAPSIVKAGSPAPMVENRFYSVRIDPATGSIAGLRFEKRWP
jgi:hypothetical protein